MTPTKNNLPFTLTIIVALAVTAYLVALMYTEVESHVLMLLAGENNNRVKSFILHNRA